MAISRKSFNRVNNFLTNSVPVSFVKNGGHAIRARGFVRAKTENHILT